MMYGTEVVEIRVWIHDRTGRRLSQEHRDLESGRRNVERYVYDDRGHVIEIRAVPATFAVPVSDALGRRTVTHSSDRAVEAR